MNEPASHGDGRPLAANKVEEQSPISPKATEPTSAQHCWWRRLGSRKMTDKPSSSFCQNNVTSIEPHRRGCLPVGSMRRYSGPGGSIH
jgi:hypothetical protein